MTREKSIGKPMDRVDGKLKVTGAARYFADNHLPDLLHGCLVCSTITSGKIKTIDATAALRAPGVVDVVSHLNTPPAPGYKQADPSAKQPLRIFADDRIYSNGQPVAIVVADTMERAVHAASLVQVTYDQETHQTDMLKNLSAAFQNSRMKDYVRGKADAWKEAPVKLEASYTTPVEVHNPMELAGIVAKWDTPDQLTIWSKTQAVKNNQQALKGIFQIPVENITIHSPFVGGGFGMALHLWPHEIATIIAARKLRKPVKLVITRDQMFTMVGYRPTSIQKIGIGATADGKLTGITHEAIANTSVYEDFTEAITSMSKFMYACPNVNTKYQLVPVNLATPIWMRGPGEATGSFALECAVDELAHQLNIDPIDFRVLNYTETDPERELPFSSNYLKEAYQMGAEKIGWHNRHQQPGAVKEGDWYVGYGISTGTFGAHRGKATVGATFNNDGSLLLQSATSDIGPGTATAMVQIAADAIGLDPEKITFQLGESAYPQAPEQGGSATVATVGAAVHDVCQDLKKELARLAIENIAAFKNSKAEELTFEDGFIVAGNNRIALHNILTVTGKPDVKINTTSAGGDERKKYSMYSYSVHFAKVHVHARTGVVRIKHVVSVADSGTIVNAKTATSQMIGGVVGGIGMALTEEAVMDHRFGRYANNNFGDYHVPVHADIPPTDILFVNKKDPYINPMGAKGMGEIALIGFAAAVANAVFNATGKRVRDLPITPDKLIS
ncbi:xanthine dehydrogenase family protein molybdopterin-binding subunit [Chitinophaga sp. Cy-1792]|uniref:xanthine dehydrogenase family protein molybdopterin-binding subunit n=1 Tax=Chitinophaga sp. Cy-1792 TaxID=2608339 RepID=UPI001420E8B9|nr:xanthine dehydrogenase family protein molybdopterin-binding subunit [Chitinophaga sp. Cy-1792]NIG57417.1 xanthine dehydrogenase family protein molybdopterin-binding subunit [Chitinophaga sp. Cy-1792]